MSDDIVREFLVESSENLDLLDRELINQCLTQGVVVIDEQMASLNMTRAEFHGEWNYTIKPRSKPNEATVS